MNFNVVGKLERRLARQYYRLTGFRPGSAPYVTGDGFRALAGLVYEPGSEKGKTVERGDPAIVFVHGHLLPQVWEGELSKISRSFVLISHNSDFDPTYLQQTEWPIGLVHWFGENLRPLDSRTTPLPIGVENLSLANHGFAFRKRLCAPRGHQPKSPRILYGFSLANNPQERGTAKRVLESISISSAIQGSPSPEEYLRVLARYALVASPAGNGTDCHRTWEAMYHRTAPIVIRNSLTEAFKSLGLPLVLIDQWSDLASWTEEAVEGVVGALEERWDAKALFMDFWLERIQEAAAKC